MSKAAADPIKSGTVRAASDEKAVMPERHKSKKYLFTTKTCPNCQLAKEYLEDVDYVVIDAEEDEDRVHQYGVMQAPMTAIFLIAEITGGYDLLLPLILCATTSYGITRTKEKYSIYTKRIARNGDLLTHDSDQAVMTLLQTRDLVRDKYPRLRDEDSLADISAVVAESTVAVFPVLNSDGHFCGILEMDDIRKHIFDQDNLSGMKVRDLMHAPVDIVFEDEKMDSVMAKFDRTDVWRLPVLTREGIYLGFISKSRILAAYREELKLITTED